MDATQVMKAMNEQWMCMMDNYYDHVCGNYLEFLSKEYNLDLDELKEKVAPLKEKILATATATGESPGTCNTTKTKAQKTTASGGPSGVGGKYSGMPRKQLVELCKANSLPVKRKNQDMVDALDALSARADEAQAAASNDPQAAVQPTSLEAEMIDE